MSKVESPELRTLIPAEVIERRMEVMAAEIVADFKKKRKSESDVITIVLVLDGAIDFVVDLRRAIRRLGISTKTVTIRSSSYGNDTVSSGDPTIDQDFSAEDIEEQYIVLADDLIDEGFTLEKIGSILADLKPCVLHVAVMLAKVRRGKVKSNFKFKPGKVFTGFYVPKLLWIVGRGVDLAGGYRDKEEVIGYLRNKREKWVAANYLRKAKKVGHENWRP
ncbi:MAG: hypothetical protein COY80_01330 [Candidatus Pacebacteria bacterium CG_4_10_14_0_8_um_filter_42_14]|nr:MAG: hypothetical protein COY80_01330 [Candidatus Pacebacteria bacterium CG_4_10_14_0_8_um_filter_42_14]